MLATYSRVSRGCYDEAASVEFQLDAIDETTTLPAQSCLPWYTIFSSSSSIVGAAKMTIVNVLFTY